jgi:two-component system cell cycle sensor histidine kinase/response regulator CckA
MSKFLIVDDNAHNLYLQKVLLEGHGHEVLSAANGVEALEKARDDPPDVIITDILMPVMDGFTLCKEWKKDNRLKEIPLIFYTCTYTDPKDKEFALGLGADRFLVKPMKAKAFIEIIHSVVKDAERGKIAPGGPASKPEVENYRLYSQRLVKKLEKKMSDLEREISERKLAEEALRESEEKYRHLIRHSNDAIYVLYKQKFEIINDKFLEMFGLIPGDINKPGFNLMDLVAPESKPLIEERRRKLADGEKLSSKYEFTALSKDGREIQVEASVSYINYRDGVAALGVLRDITERKKLEQEFLQAQKMEAVGRLAGGVAHDFNNLLSVIIGYSQLMIMRLNKNDSMYKLLKEIEHAGLRAETLTRQLLAFSRKQVLQPKVLDIKDLIKNMEKMLKRLIEEDIELTIQNENGCIKADPGQIEQVIMNLVVNARDAMPKGGKLTIESKNIDFKETFTREDVEIKPGQYLVIGISDTGTGMDKEILSHIFEPFFTTKKEGKGTGLGLSTVYGIIKQSGGYIDVYSKPGLGTTFKIYFPRVEGTAEKIEKFKPTGESLKGNETILVAEDEDVVRNLAGQILRMYGYNVLEAPHGGSALLKCEQNKTIHLILTDVIMPEMNGKELVERLLPYHPGMKVLYMSGYTDDEVIQHGVLEEKVPFIQKPFTPMALLKKVRKVLDNKSKKGDKKGAGQKKLHIEKREKKNKK